MLHISHESAHTETMSKEWRDGLQFPTITIFYCYNYILNPDMSAMVRKAPRLEKKNL